MGRRSCSPLFDRREPEGRHFTWIARRLGAAHRAASGSPEIRHVAQRVRGFTLIELLIAMALGLIVIGGALTVFLALRQVSATTKSQALIQDGDNAISALLSPAIRGAGFGGCGTLGGALNITNWGALVNNYSLAVQGYDANGTGGTGTVTIAADNAAGDSTAGDWAPSLDASLGSAGIAPETGSDVLVVSGALPNTAPAGVSAIATGATSFTVTDNPLANVATTLTTEGVPNSSVPAALSDCGKAVVFMVTNVAGSGSVTVSHGTPANTVATFVPSFPPGSQFIPLQQAAFYVGQGPGGTSALYRAVYVGGTWVATPIVPGVENMQVLYGISSNGTYQWLSGNAVASGPGFATVSAVRVGFLMEGASGSVRGASAASFNVLGTSVTVPTDSRLRHVFVLTVNLRNAGL